MPFKSFFSLALLSILFVGCTQNQSTSTEIQEITLTGTATTDDWLTYRMLPFTLPAGVGAIEVEYHFSGEGNEVEIGLYDPNGFRGSSRFSKSAFYVGKYSATASYFHGKLDAGEWNIMLSFPTLKTDTEYEVNIRVIPETNLKFTGPDDFSLSDETRWYAGDFHTHTGHSDGFGCKDTEGKRTPCQVYQNAKVAHDAGLDFVGIADHNTVSHYQDIRTLQPIYPDLLLIRGQEVTTFFGHVNAYGSGVPVNFKIGYEGYNMAQMQEEVAKTGALLSINHPGRKTGAECTGCGWSEESTDYSKLEVMEVINGTEVETAISGIPVWDGLLNEGYRIIGIGGSDDHNAKTIGIPTTMVFAEALSEQGLLAAVREGKVYIRTQGNDSPEIEFWATSRDKKWEMGEVIPTSDLEEGTLTVHLKIEDKGRSRLELIKNGVVTNIPESAISRSGNSASFSQEVEVQEGDWVRINLRNEEGEITVISNPVFVR